MRVIQTVLGVFNHFELARELERRQLLDTVYSTFPWQRLKREGLPRHRIDTFPWLQTPQFLAERHGFLPRKVLQQAEMLNRSLFDRHVLVRTRDQPAPDALIAGSGSVYEAALVLQRRGTRWICDRGSTHQRHMQKTLTEESLRWGITPKTQDSRILQLEENSYAAADAITVPSHSAAETFLNHGIPPGKLHVLPYGVRLENFTRQAAPPGDAFHVLFLGAVSLRKGVPYLLQAFAALEHPNKHLSIVGVIQPELRTLLPNLPTLNVSFTTHVRYNDLPTLISRHHLLALPSIEDGFGLVVPMALACGTPVLVSTAAGAGELITDTVEGFLHAPRDTRTMSARMVQLAHSPALQSQMSQAALTRVQTLGGWQTYGDRWQALLHQGVQYKE